MKIDKPILCVDLDRAQKNLETLAAKLPAECKVRLSTKSIRCPELLSLLSRSLGPKGRGVMCFHPDEISFLFDQGFNDVLLAYPLLNESICQRLATLQKSARTDQKFYLMVDLPEHVAMVSRAANELGVRLNVVIDLVVSTRFPGIHFGVHRSSIQSPKQLVELAKRIAGDAHLNLSGIMSYEAQIAGVADRDPRESWHVAAVKRFLKARSLQKISSVRKQVADSLPDLLSSMNILNGGGSGSVGSTGHDPLVNEVTIGSGILCPALFEHYTGLAIEPAIAFALPVVRRPEPNIATLFAGGYIASGSSGANKQPRLFYPGGWSLVANEGFGEVQTPLKKKSATTPDLRVGDTCFFVPAKSGEVMERFQRIYSATLDGKPQIDMQKSFKTYRGHGECFA